MDEKELSAWASKFEETLDMSDWREKRTTMLRRLFEAFDIETKGFLTKSILLELGEARRSLGHKSAETQGWDEAKAAKMMNRFDSDGDGRVSDVEFVLAFSESLPYDEARSSSLHGLIIAHMSTYGNNH